MALLVTKDNRPIFLAAEQANLLWLIHTGERKGTPKTEKKVSKICKWYLNYATAPASYQATHSPVGGIKHKPLANQVRMPYID